MKISSTKTKSISKPHFKQNSNHKNAHSNNKSKNQNQRSLLQKIASNFSSDRQIYQNGKIIITKLEDYNQEKCLYGKDCSHLRAQGKCQFLHEKKDYQYLSIPLPQKYLQNEEPAKKSKQQRKQDKIKEKAERQRRLKQKLQKQNTRNDRNQQKQQDHNEETVIQKKQKKGKQQKNIDAKQVLIQKIVKMPTGQQLTLGYIYSQLNQITDAYCKRQNNGYSNQLQNIQLTMFEVRKRLLMKFKKNKQYEAIFKLFVQKEAGFIKKIFKNIVNKYKQIAESIENLQQNQILDLTQIQQQFDVNQMDRVLHSKKQNEQIIEYYFRFFKQDYGFPIAFDPFYDQDNSIKITKGNLLTLANYQVLALLNISSKLQRIFVTSQTQFHQFEASCQFHSLSIPHLVLQKQPVHKIYAINMSSITYNKLVQKIQTQFSSDYQQKMKGIGKQFQFGKIQENLKKYRTFIAKYKSKIQKQNQQNTFTLIIYNIKQLLDKIVSLNMQQNLEYGSIKKDRTIEQQNVYEKVFLLRQLLTILGQNLKVPLKIIYVDNKKLKMKKYQKVLQQIDGKLKKQQKTIEPQQVQKIVEQA